MDPIGNDHLRNVGPVQSNNTLMVRAPAYAGALNAYWATRGRIPRTCPLRCGKCAKGMLEQAVANDGRTLGAKGGGPCRRRG